MACAYGQRSFVAPHVVSDGAGLFQGVLWDVRGGQQKTVDSSTSQWGFIGLEALASPVGNDGLLNWLVKNVNGGVPAPATWDIYSLVKGESLVWWAFEALPQSITFPACDVDSKDPGGIAIQMGANLKLLDGVIAPKNSDASRKQKMWLTSNFRLRMGDLPCARTQRLGQITQVRQSVDRAQRYSSSPLVFEVPMADAPAFQKAFEQTLAGTPIVYPVEVDYLDADGNLLIGVTTQMVIRACGPTNLWLDSSDPAATFRVLASIQEENKTFSQIIR